MTTFTAAQAVSRSGALDPAGLRIVIGAGGTGGHIYPGLAIADAILKRVPEAKISFTGTSRGLEGTLVPKFGYELATSSMIPFAASMGWRRFALPVYLLRAGIDCARRFRRDGVDLVIGMGGYPSSPAIVGAWLAGIPRLIHESNARSGKANQVAALLSDHIGIAFDHAQGQLPSLGKDVRRVGVPLMPAVVAMNRAGLRSEAVDSLGVSPDQRLVVVNGGSQGARSLTKAALELAALWRDRTDVMLLIKTGPADYQAAVQRIEELKASHGTRVVAYMDRMDLVYAAADVMVGRSGAATVAELAHIGLPAVLIPHPWAAGDHQRHNAEVLVECGGAVMMTDQELTGARLADELEVLLADPDRLERMSESMRSAEHSQAADSMAQWAIDLAQEYQASNTSRAAARH
ncbi:UDP-N-acetylglucosamine--N-acetylmuramyl-(pentapeptide) pyrophosphoryl-undecaprenol N-acetylglucosamine transferase [Saxibacter everestensis]|uniref:UDP-N-acetylglucosamine--N-acetylmuramyl-(pentapeptide) pyrophosphoryl-undecaprenol N-acetylglucosamine transferase n=1 Tax=Saxibacter everestensis TaxID=2909229 RepID=A0ABY8QXE9_9MICO|nr:UDP-N-acetylglucosamine--N-acetylmuramyl-(pentapeptide) pyrophosphoryl-undecaprenol N-acetylglucosamine transferase [Brevibacteriaceae bacterium ZFBP1038]